MCVPLLLPLRPGDRSPGPRRRSLSLRSQLHSSPAGPRRQARSQLPPTPGAARSLRGQDQRTEPGLTDELRVRWRCRAAVSPQEPSWSSTGPQIFCFFCFFCFAAAAGARSLRQGATRRQAAVTAAQTHGTSGRLPGKIKAPGFHILVSVMMMMIMIEIKTNMCGKGNHLYLLTFNFSKLIHGVDIFIFQPSFIQGKCLRTISHLQT